MSFSFCILFNCFLYSDYLFSLITIIIIYMIIIIIIIMMMMIILVILGRPIHAVRYVHLTINRQRRGLFIRLVKNRVRINH